MNSETPKSIPELFEFYYDFVKPLYSQIQTENALPHETLFELNAALDHISRIWHYEEPEDHAVERAYGHLKRSCLDIFKLRVKEARNQFEELRKIDTSIIRQGEFDSELIDLFSELKLQARNARSKEGEYRSTNEQEHAFELWLPVLEMCITLEQKYYRNDAVNWAKKRQSYIGKKKYIISISAAFLGGILVNYVFPMLTDFIKSFFKVFNTTGRH